MDYSIAITVQPISYSDYSCCVDVIASTTVWCFKQHSLLLLTGEARVQSTQTENVKKLKLSKLRTIRRINQWQKKTTKNHMFKLK